MANLFPFPYADSTKTANGITYTVNSDESVTETVIPRALASTATRHTGRDGKAIWKGIGLQIQFINAHN